MKSKAVSAHQYKAELSLSILKEYQNLCRLITKIPFEIRNEKIMDGTGGKISISDVVAYQIGWANRVLEWYEAGISNKEIVMPGDGFSKWDYVGIALHFYNKYHYDGGKKQDLIFADLVSKIINIVEIESETGNLDKTGIWKWCTLGSGKQWPLNKWIKINTASPYKAAHTMIKNIF